MQQCMMWMLLPQVVLPKNIDAAGTTIIHQCNDGVGSLQISYAATPSIAGWLSKGSTVEMVINSISK